MSKLFSNPIVKIVTVVILTIVGLKIIVPMLPLPDSVKAYLTV